MEGIEKLREYARNTKTVFAEPLAEIADEIEAEIEREYMRLPVDADGVPIHLGDELDNINKSERYKVTSIGDNGYIRIYSDTGWIHSSHCRHVKPDPIKKLLEEYAGKRFARSNMGLDIEGLADDYAAKIREAVSADE